MLHWRLDESRESRSRLFLIVIAFALSASSVSAAETDKQWAVNASGEVRARYEALCVLG